MSAVLRIGPATAAFQICADDGGIVAHDDTGREGIAFADLDLELVADSRAHPEPPGLANIRPDIYARVDATRAAGVTT